MRKSLLTLAAFALTLAANAQGFKALPFSGQLEKANAAAIQAPFAKKAPRKADLKANQRLIGYYTTDDADNALSVSSYTTGTVQPGVLLESSDYGRYIGKTLKAVRFAMGVGATASGVEVFGITAQGAMTSLASVDTTIVSKSTQNADYSLSLVWNTVDLGDKAFTLSNDYAGYMITYKVKQDANAYPLAVNTNVSGRVMYAYLNIPQSLGGNGQSWYNFGDSYAWAIQGVVEGDFPSNDLSLVALQTGSKFYKDGDQAQYAVVVSNQGSAAADYELGVTLDGQSIGTLTSSKSLATLANDTIQGTFSVPANAAVGNHELAVKVNTINGEVPTDMTEDDNIAATWKVYKASVPRQKALVEHHTSSSCTYCYLGEAFLEELAKEDDHLAWVSIHGIQNSAYPDPTNTAQCDTLIAYQNLSGWPSAGFNRSMYFASDNSSYLAVISYNQQYLSQVVPVFSQAIQADEAANPSFVTLNIGAKLNDRQLTVEVGGVGVDGTSELLGDERLYVYLAEDSLKFNQLTNGRWVNNDNHNQVFRVALGTVFGNEINWNGNNFDQTFSYNLPETWKLDNLKIVAFVAPRLDVADVNDAFVNQAQQIYLKDAPTTGINSISADNATENSQVVARYNAAGQRIATAQPGLNILKLANGKTVKVIVK